MAHYDAKSLKTQARGRWLEIFTALAPTLQPAVEHLGRHVPCPVHGGSDGFRLFPNANDQGGGICNTCGARNDGFALLAWVNGWTFGETVKAVGLYLNGIRGVYPRGQCHRIPFKKDVQHDPNPQRDAYRAEAIRALWDDSVSLSTSDNEGVEAVCRYLKRRGIGDEDFLRRLDPDSLRAVEALRYWVPDESPAEPQWHRGMVAQVIAPNGNRVTLHRTYLADNGLKASVERPRKLMGMPSDVTVNGSAIRLMPVQGETLAVAEGIETALSVAKATGLPCWSVICANGLRTFALPDDLKGRIQRVLIYADNDRSNVGLAAAQVLAKRLRSEGLRAKIWLPSTPDTDWNDVLRAGMEIPH